MNPGGSSAKDRLAEFRQIQKCDNLQNISNDDPLLEKETVVVDINVVKNYPEINTIFEKVQIIRIWINTIVENTNVIKEITKNSTTSKKLIHDEIEKRVKNTTNLALKISKKIEELNVKFENKSKDKSALSRMQRIQYATLRQEFQNAIFENNNILEKYRDRQKFLLHKQAALVNSALTDDEIEAILDNPHGAQLFTGNILLETQQAKDQLVLIEERHSELLKIEKLLEEVRDMFIKVAILVEQQKEHIDRIEFHACDAINYVDQGLIEIQKAEKNRKKTKRVSLIIVFCIIIAFLILLLIFLK